MSDLIVEVNDGNFEEKVLRSPIPILVDFWAPWCGPCLAIAPTLETLAAEFKGRVTVAKMNVDENKHVPTTYGVRSIPYLVCFKNGEVVESTIGAVGKPQLTRMLDKALS